MNINIVGVTILRMGGADIVTLETDLPTTMPALSQDNLYLRFEVAAGKAPEYLAKHFPGLATSIVDVIKERTKFSRVNEGKPRYCIIKTEHCKAPSCSCPDAPHNNRLYPKGN